MATYTLTYWTGSVDTLNAPDVEAAYRAVYGLDCGESNLFVIDQDYDGVSVEPYGVVSNRHGDDVCKIEKVSDDDLIDPDEPTPARKAADAAAQEAATNYYAIRARIDDLRSALSVAQDELAEAEVFVKRATEVQAILAAFDL